MRKFYYTKWLQETEFFFSIEKLKSSPQIKISINASHVNHEIIHLEITQS